MPETKRVEFHLRASDYETLKALADEERLSVSAFLRQAALGYGGTVARVRALEDTVAELQRQLGGGAAAVRP